MRNVAGVFFVLLLALSVGCETSDSKPLTSFNGIANSMHYRVLVGVSLNRSQRNEVERIISKTFQEIDLIYNNWNPRSELSRLNNIKKGEKIRLSKKLAKFLHQVDRFVSLTKGRFDPSIEAVQRVWKQALEKGKLPKESQLNALSAASGWSHVHISNRFFWKDDERLAIDLGGIAKGYAIDLIVERLNAAGYKNVYVEWGGEIRTSGNHPSERPWRIFINNQAAPDLASALAIVDMQNNAIASSGDYLQFWTVDGKTYCHIFDPRTGCPISSTQKERERIGAVSLIASSCMAADALATATMVFKKREHAQKWLEQIQKEAPDLGISAWWIGRGEDDRVDLR